PDVPGAVVIHGRYPLAPYLRAFEFAVCSAGYNSVHENLAVGLAAVYVPNTAAVTDDQSARAELVARAGMGFVARSEAELHVELRRLVVVEVRSCLGDALSMRAGDAGAEDTVMRMLEVIDNTRIEDLHPGGKNNDSICR